VTALPRWP